ncbi:death-associated protein 1-like [Saccostrea echinata]|uniref:death-associated protein 1-like n=1 Tax=Saccostrea echinata TaxID=191078 RepID=UPI002A822275|nr:death-associated protein 1-like [Saccostrea echinata]
MSDAQEESDLLAGHPPAVKAGGMRIVQHKQPDKSDSHQSREEKQEQAEEFGTVDVSADKHHQSILLSGAVTKGDKDFPPEAVKSYHQKPLPTHENRPVQKPHIIQQPR